MAITPKAITPRMTATRGILLRIPGFSEVGDGTTVGDGMGVASTVVLPPFPAILPVVKLHVYGSARLFPARLFTLVDTEAVYIVAGSRLFIGLKVAVPFWLPFCTYPTVPFTGSPSTVINVNVLLLMVDGSIGSLNPTVIVPSTYIPSALIAGAV